MSCKNAFINDFYVISKDFRLLSFNQSAADAHKGIQTGDICYKAIMNRSTPCLHCPLAGNSENWSPVYYDTQHRQNIRAVFSDIGDGKFAVICHSEEENRDSSAQASSCRVISEALAGKVKEEWEKNSIYRAVSSMFYVLCDIDLVHDTYVRVIVPKPIEEFTQQYTGTHECLQQVAKHLFFPEEYERVSKFYDSHRWKDLLRDRDTVYDDFHGIYTGWNRTNLIAAERDQNGDPTRIIFAIQDVDEEHKKSAAIEAKIEKQQKDLQDALTAAQHANNAKTTFLNNMSHDIRTPMNAIIGFTALAASHINNKEQVQRYLEKISTSSQHLLSLINDVLDMSRIESGRVKIEEMEVHLPDVMHDLRTIVQSSVTTKNLDLYLDTVDIVNEDIICDKLRLNQILLNLLSNATKFTKSGGTISVRVIQKPCKAAGYANFEFHVKDNGIGMSEAFQKQIFEAFTREESSTVSGIQGTGLGMAITKNIVDMMGGTISVKSKENVGTEFIVSFTFKICGNTLKYEHIPQLQGVHALVADDDFNTAISVSKMLTEIGMRADWTLSGKEAVLRTQAAVDLGDEYGAYIIDWLMPDMNGIETVRRIRRVIGDTYPIIILTAYDWTDIEEEAREVGVTAFVSKPIFLSELRDVLSAPFSVKKKTESKTSAEDFIGKNVLVVEDNLLNQEITAELLQQHGFHVTIVGDGTEAVNTMYAAQSGQYDLILMDIQMPKMDGYEATRQIRRIPNTQIATIPIIAVTANAFEEDKKRALEVGMTGHLSKPIDVSQLLKMLRDTLQ